MKLRIGDKVKVLSGKDKGKTGKITQVFPVEEKVVVEGINKMTKHLKKQNTQQGKQGGEKIQFAAPIHMSNVAFIDPKDSKTTRVGFKILEDGRKVRISKKSGETIEASTTSDDKNKKK